MKTINAIALAILATGFARESSAQTIYLRQHDMLVQAIRNGSADGVMTGDTAELFKKQFKSDGQLLAHAEVIGQFNRADCKRIQVVYTKKEVITDKGPQDLKMNMKLNYCIDGKPPIGLEAKQ
jgi:hypothetical protein